MHQYMGSAWILCFCFMVWPSVWACDAINAHYQPYGEVVSLNNEMMRGPATSLEYMLDSLAVRAHGDPVTIAVRIHLDPATLNLIVTQELNTGALGRMVSHRVTCESTAWVYSEAGSGSAEGVYRDRNVIVNIHVMGNGDLKIRREKHLVLGLIFKTKDFYSMVSTFKKIPISSDDMN